jgi:transketolase
MRAKTPVVYDGSYRFQLGKWDRLRDGSDVTIMAIADMVPVALDAADKLAADGVSARVLNASSLRPFDRDAIVAAAAETGAIVTAEDHFIHGALGGIVAETLVEERPAPVEFVGMRDRYGTSGPSDVVLEYFGLTAGAIAASARKAIDRKNK